MDIEGHALRRGVISRPPRHSPVEERRGQPEPVVAGINLVGLAFDYDDNLIVAESGSLFSVPLGITGKPLP